MKLILQNSIPECDPPVLVIDQKHEHELKTWDGFNENDKYYHKGRWEYLSVLFANKMLYGNITLVRRDYMDGTLDSKLDVYYRYKHRRGAVFSSLPKDRWRHRAASELEKYLNSPEIVIIGNVRDDGETKEMVEKVSECTDIDPKLIYLREEDEWSCYVLDFKREAFYSSKRNKLIVLPVLFVDESFVGDIRI